MARARRSTAGGRPADVLTLRTHPRAHRQIRKLRSTCGLAALALAVWLSWRAGAPLFDSMVRGLVAGVAATLLAWACAVLAWRQLALAEIEAARRRRIAALTAAAEASDR